MYCVCDTCNVKHHYDEVYFGLDGSPFSKSPYPTMIYMGTSCKDCGRPKMPAVKPQVELPPYKVIDPRISSRMSMEQDWDFINKTGAFREGLLIHQDPGTIVSYHFHWQPYFLMKVSKCRHS